MYELNVAEAAEASLTAARLQGRLCGGTIRSIAQLRTFMNTNADLFVSPPFNSDMICAAAMANVFELPELSADQLWAGNYMTMWVFAADWTLERASHPGETATLRSEALDIATDPTYPPKTPLGTALRRIVDQITGAPHYETLYSRWLDELRRYLHASEKERDWTTDGARWPTMDEYLTQGAPGFGSSLVVLSHWLVNATVEGITHIDALIEASRRVQQVQRLINDLVTYHRERCNASANIVKFGVDDAAARSCLARLTDDSQATLNALQASCPLESRYLLRQIGFLQGFYGVADLWDPR